MMPGNKMVQRQRNDGKIGVVSTPQSQNRHAFVNGHGTPFPKFAVFRPNIPRSQFVQGGSPSIEVLQIMGIEVPSLRRMQYNNPMNNALNNNNNNNNCINWRSREGNSVPATRFDYPKQMNGHPNKKSNWNYNKQRRDMQRGNEPRQNNANPGNFNTRSNTPGRFSDCSQSSDDRDSLSSLAEQVCSVKVFRRRSFAGQHSRDFESNESPMAQRNPSHNHSSFFHQNNRNQGFGGFRNNDRSPARSFQGQYQNRRRNQFESHDRNRLPTSQMNQRNQKFLVQAQPTFAYQIPRQNLIAPDRFLARSHLVEATMCPQNLVNGSSWDDLSRSIWEKFVVNQQTEQTFRKKMMLWRYLYLHIKSFFPRYSLFLVGSTMNGFGANSSDMDMCLIVKNMEIYNRIDAIIHLEQIKKCLQTCEFMKNVELIQAKVPILKFFDDIQGLEVDLNYNCAVGIQNTHLLYCYSRIDWRVRPLVLVIKLWAQVQDINSAKDMTISSYSLALMVIFFLQCGANPAILPCLHKLYKGKFEPGTDIYSIDLHEELDFTNGQRPHLNKQLLGELLLDFFNYYANFKYSEYAISVRVASKIPIEECRRFQSSKNDPYQWKNLCIEEPFCQTNTAHSVYDPEIFERIKRIFSLSYWRLLETRDLSSIFVKLNADT